MSIKINIINRTGLADSDIFLMLWRDIFTATLPAIYPNYLKILAFSVRIKGFRQGKLEKAWLFHVDTI